MSDLGERFGVLRRRIAKLKKAQRAKSSNADGAELEVAARLRKLSATAARVADLVETTKAVELPALMVLALICLVADKAECQLTELSKSLKGEGRKKGEIEG